MLASKPAYMPGGPTASWCIQQYSLDGRSQLGTCTAQPRVQAQQKSGENHVGAAVHCVLSPTTGPPELLIESHQAVLHHQAPTGKLPAAACTYSTLQLPNTVKAYAGELDRCCMRLLC